ncbi:MAG: hypothetical protein ACFE9Z_02630 [Promethearchaeota archaeon]
MSLYSAVEKEQLLLQKFIDWDKFENIFYNNFYLENYKLVIKIPLLPQEKNEKDLRIKKFNLEKYTFLISYD